MARYDKMQVMNKMASTGMVPVFYHPTPEVACQVMQACYDGGVRVFEFTNRGDFAHEVFARCMKYAGEHCPDMAVGARWWTHPQPLSISRWAHASLWVRCSMPKWHVYATAARYLMYPDAVL